MTARIDALRLLRRLGTTTGQILTMTTWQTLLVGAVGLVLGMCAGAATLAAVTRALTGSWSPYLPASSALGLVVAVAGVVAAGTIVPTLALRRD